MPQPSQELNKEIIEDLQSILGEGFKEIMIEQIEQAREYLGELKTLIQKSEPRNASLKSHALKSSAGQVGLQGIQFLAKDIEFSCRKDMETGEISSQSRELFYRLEQEFEPAIRHLLAFTGKK